MTSSSGSSSSSSSSGSDKKAPMPVGVGYAPTGAYLGTDTKTGQSLVSMGTGDANGAGNTASYYNQGEGYFESDGRTVRTDPNDQNRTIVTLPTPTEFESTPTETKYVPVVGGTGGASGGGVRPETLVGTKGGDGSGGGTGTGGGGTGGGGTGGGGTDGTGGGGGGSGGGSIDTSVNTNPRGDFSVVLAGMQGEKANRGPARSNSFISLIGGAGGLGRRTSEAKRTLIGGA